MKFSPASCFIPPSLVQICTSALTEECKKIQIANLDEKCKTKRKTLFLVIQKQPVNSIGHIIFSGRMSASEDRGTMYQNNDYPNT